jgi:UDP-arabinose 4-epimerase
MKKILVTGGAGYIGSHTCKLLAQAGYEPVTFDNLSTGHKEFVKWGPLVVGNLHDTVKLVKTLLEHAPLSVIHFAGSAYVGESVTNPFKYYKNNVGGTLSLLEAMRQSSVSNIVFSSTCATYGIPNEPTISESCSQLPINPYGRSKLMIEQILGDLASKQELNHICLRYFNAAGADKDGEIGEKHDTETHLIPLAVLSAFGGDVLHVFGTDFPTKDGTAIRDYVHVEDLGRAHILAVEHLLTGGSSEYINLGTGRGNSVNEIITELKKQGLKVNAKKSTRRYGDPVHLVANASKANQVLNWKAEYTDIGKILETAVLWHKKNV